MCCAVRRGDVTVSVRCCPACGAQADMVFMLDSSGSVGPSNFKLLLSFVNSMVKDFDVAQDRIRIGVEEFSSRPYTEFHLNKYNTKAEVLAAVNNISYRSGGTNTGQRLVVQRSFTLAGHDLYVMLTGMLGPECHPLQSVISTGISLRSECLISLSRCPPGPCPSM